MKQDIEHRMHKYKGPCTVCNIRYGIESKKWYMVNDETIVARCAICGNVQTVSKVFQTKKDANIARKLADKPITDAIQQISSSFYIDED